LLVLVSLKVFLFPGEKCKLKETFATNVFRTVPDPNGYRAEIKIFAEQLGCISLSLQNISFNMRYFLLAHCTNEISRRVGLQVKIK